MTTFNQNKSFTDKTTLTKSELCELLKPYPDDIEVRVIVNERDIRKAEMLRTTPTMPLEFELSNLCFKTGQDLKINAWVHLTRESSFETAADRTASPPVNAFENTLHTFKGRVQGRVKWFNSKKGIGFLQTDHIGQDIFVHYEDIKSIGFKTLTMNSWVEFSLYITSRGPRAKDVCVLHMPHSLAGNPD